MTEVVIEILGYIAVLLFGVVIGSFLNVCIFRIPKKESIVPASHCMSCGYHLKWYDNIPVLSYLMLRGRCRKCHTKLSLQYPLVEGFNGVLYVIVFLANGWNLTSIVYCLLTSALIVLSVIDFRTYIIPNKVSLFILVLGIADTVLDYEHWQDHVIGFFSVSAVLLILYLVTVGRAIGGGDIKLMAVAGLIIGWKANILAFIVGCIVGSVLHLIRMKVSGAEHRLALGPYLSVGIWFAMLFGDPVIQWYLTMCGL
ncbi:MAG: prepilin peptidase [Lachnospiraceae bacterium]|nr:prepilin peptidase [Lachnospiraceae bacterium]